MLSVCTRVENSPTRIEGFFVQRRVKTLPRKSAEIVFNFDATDDPLHGSQRGAYFHGFFAAAAACG